MIELILSGNKQQKDLLFNNQIFSDLFANLNIMSTFSRDGMAGEE